MSKQVKRKVNVVFQIGSNYLAWDQTPIVYTLKNVDDTKPLLDILHCLSVINGYTTVRAARLFLNEELTPERACRYNGIYYQASLEH